jgi:hypothetical protein
MPVVSVPALAHSQATAKTLSLCKKIRFTPPLALRQSSTKQTYL